MAELNHYLGRSYPRIDDDYRRALKGHNIKEYDFFISFRFIDNVRHIVFSNEGARPDKVIHPDDYIDIDFHMWGGDDAKGEHVIFRHYSYCGPAKHLMDNNEFYISYDKFVVGGNGASKINIDYQVGAEVDHISMPMVFVDYDMPRSPSHDATSRYHGRYYHDDERGARITLASHRGRSYLALNPTLPTTSQTSVDLSKYAEWYFEIPNIRRNDVDVAVERGGTVVMTINLYSGESVVKRFESTVKKLITETVKLYGNNKQARDFVYPAGEQNSHIRRVVLGPSEFRNQPPLSDSNGKLISPTDIRTIEFQFLTYQGNDTVYYHSILYPQLQVQVWDESNYADVTMDKRRLIFASYYVEPVDPLPLSHKYRMGVDLPVSRVFKYNLNAVIDNQYLTTVKHAPISKNQDGEMIVGRNDINSDYIMSKSRVATSKGLYVELIDHDGAVVSVGRGNLGRTQLIRRNYDDSNIVISSVSERTLSSPGYAYITENNRLYLIFNHNLMSNQDIALYAKFKNGHNIQLRRVGNLYYTAYETYEMTYPENMSHEEIFRILNEDNNYIQFYRVSKSGDDFGSGLFRTKISLYSVRRDGVGGQIRGFIHGRTWYGSLHVVKPMQDKVKLNLRSNLHNTDEYTTAIQEIIAFTKSGVKSANYEQISPDGDTLVVPKSYFDYNSTNQTYQLNAIIYKRQTSRTAVVARAVFVDLITQLEPERRDVDRFPGVRYIQIGTDRTIVGYGDAWHARPSISKQPEPGYLKYTAEDGTTATCTQTADSPNPGTYYYSNDKTSRGVYPKEAADGSVTFTVSWDSGIELVDNAVKLYKDPYIPGLYSIRPTYNYTNVCHHGHIATDSGSHWFALPGKFVETASLGTNVDYTERRKVLMNSVNSLTVSDNYVGDFWEEGRFVALAADIPYNNQSKQAPSKRINVRSQNSNKPYNYYYGNSFLKTNATFDNSPNSLNASIDYGDEDKLPDINQDFTTNCGYNNSNRDLSDWTVSRVYYDHMKRLRFGSENSDYSRVNYRGGTRNLTPDGITPLVDGIATLVNGGTIRVQSGTKSLFTNTPQCAVIEGDIIVDATGNGNEFPLELYKKDTLVAGVLIMRGRILIKGSENLNPFIGIRNPTLVINETQWDLNQLFAVMPKPRIPRNYRVIGGILRNGDGVIFVEDTKNLGIPASISSLRNMTVVNMGKTILSDKSVFMIAGNLHTAQIHDMGYFETASFGTCKLIDEISRHITQETIPFGYNGYESISFPYYLTPRIGADDDGRYGYPATDLRQDIYNHTLYTYDFTGKYYYTEERRGRYRKQYNWYYHTGTAEGFYDFVKNKMKTDDNRELINAKRILVSYEGASSNVVYKMASSIDEALRLVVWNQNSRRSVSFYIFD